MKQKKNKENKILITGGAGYIGSSLVSDALDCGYAVRCLDLLLYGPESIRGFLKHPNFEFVKGDIRNKEILKKSLKGTDYVVHLAAIVGDVPCRVAPEAAVEINFKGTKLLAEKAREHKVKRFIFASTCSNYGILDSEKGADEKDDLNPASLYSETKVDCEQFLNGINDKHFSVTRLRFASGYGISLRTRFDLLVNSLAYEAWTKNEVVVFAANTWRPYIHVSDMALAIRKILEADITKVRGEVFNIGFNSQNHIKKDVVKFLKKILPQLNTKYIYSVDDRRNYKVNFDKFEKNFGFKPKKNVEYGFRELIEAFKGGRLTKRDFESNKLQALERLFGEKESELKIST